MIKLKHEQFRSLKYNNVKPSWILKEISKLEYAFKSLDIEAKVDEYRVGYASVSYLINGSIDAFSEILTNLDKIKEIVHVKKINKFVEGSRIAIELPNPFRQILMYGNIIDDEYIENKSYFECPIGIGYKNEIINLNLRDNNRVLISGYRRSGKKNALNIILSSILLNIDECVIDMIDSSVDLTYLYDLTLVNLIELDSYYNELEETLNEGIKRVIVINDLADFKDDIHKIVDLLDKVRNKNIIVIILTTSFEPLILTEDLRKNIDINIALEAQTITESNFTIGSGGQENLLGMGDSFVKQNGFVKRCQIAYISIDEIEGIIKSVKGE